MADTWQKERAQETIEEIAQESVSALSVDASYPPHPKDNELQSTGSGHYVGASGVLWALDYLRRESYAVADEAWLVHQLEVMVRHIPEERGAGPMAEVVSFLFGDLPVILHLLNLTGDIKWRALAQERIEQSINDPVREIMWGTPGVLLLTGLIRDIELRKSIAGIEHKHINRLFESWNYETEGMTLWREELYGNHALCLGPVHGFTGQIWPLLRRLSSLDDSQRTTVIERTRQVLIQTAIHDGNHVNWPTVFSGEGGATSGLLQFCHGAPGIVIACCSFPHDDEVDALLENAGELVWDAGPLKKGSNLCHGTGGNGYAFLKLHERTGKSIWLDRARAFAMHGINQYRTERSEVGHGRFSLWTGDPGFAIYLLGCIKTDARFPTIDLF
jgi:lantibiotic modifying enzyme